MSTRKIIAIGGSAGAVEALSEILPRCSSVNSPPIVVVLHLGETFAQSVANHFQKYCLAKVKEAESKEPLEKGHVYFAPSGYHLLISEKHECELSVDDPVQFSRPSIDVLFESVADVYGANAAGIILSGANSDGARGLYFIEQKKGLAIVQDPATAQFREMPESAIAHTHSPKIMALSEICARVSGEQLWH